MKMRKFLGLMIVPAFALGVAACDVDQTEEGAMPDVEVEEGQMPEYDVQPADVEVTQDTSVITTPDINVENPDEAAAE